MKTFPTKAIYASRAGVTALPVLPALRERKVIRIDQFVIVSVFQPAARADIGAVDRDAVSQESVSDSQFIVEQDGRSQHSRD